MIRNLAAVIMIAIHLLQFPLHLKLVHFVVLQVDVFM